MRPPNSLGGLKTRNNPGFGYPISVNRNKETFIPVKMKIIYETFIPKVNYQVLQTNISVSRKHQKVHTGCNAYISNLIECMKDIYKKIVEKKEKKRPEAHFSF